MVDFPGQGSGQSSGNYMRNGSPPGAGRTTTPIQDATCRICKNGPSRGPTRRLKCNTCSQEGTWHIACLTNQRALLEPQQRKFVCPFHVSCTCDKARSRTQDCQVCWERWCATEHVQSPTNQVSAATDMSAPAGQYELSAGSSSMKKEETSPEFDALAPSDDPHLFTHSGDLFDTHSAHHHHGSSHLLHHHNHSGGGFELQDSILSLERDRHDTLDMFGHDGKSSTGMVTSSRRSSADLSSGLWPLDAHIGSPHREPVDPTNGSLLGDEDVPLIHHESFPRSAFNGHAQSNSYSQIADSMFADSNMSRAAMSNEPMTGVKSESSSDMHVTSASAASNGHAMMDSSASAGHHHVQGTMGINGLHAATTMASVAAASHGQQSSTVTVSAPVAAITVASKAVRPLTTSAPAPSFNMSFSIEIQGTCHRCNMRTVVLVPSACSHKWCEPCLKDRGYDPADLTRNRAAKWQCITCFPGTFDCFDHALFRSSP